MYVFFKIKQLNVKQVYVHDKDSTVYDLVKDLLQDSVLVDLSNEQQQMWQKIKNKKLSVFLKRYKLPKNILLKKLDKNDVIKIEFEDNIGLYVDDEPAFPKKQKKKHFAPSTPYYATNSPLPAMYQSMSEYQPQSPLYQPASPNNSANQMSSVLTAGTCENSEKELELTFYNVPEMSDIECESLHEITEFPKVGSFIAFKKWVLSASVVPCVSEYLQGMIKERINDSEVIVELNETSNKKLNECQNLTSGVYSRAGQKSSNLLLIEFENGMTLSIDDVVEMRLIK